MFLSNGILVNWIIFLLFTCSNNCCLALWKVDQASICAVDILWFLRQFLGTYFLQFNILFDDTLFCCWLLFDNLAVDGLIQCVLNGIIGLDRNILIFCCCILAVLRWAMHLVKIVAISTVDVIGDLA